MNQSSKTRQRRLRAALAVATAAFVSQSQLLNAQSLIFEVNINSSASIPVSTDQGVARVVGFPTVGPTLYAKMMTVSMLGTSSSSSASQVLGNGNGIGLAAISDGGSGAFIGGTGDMLFGTAGGGSNAWVARIDSQAQTVWGRDLNFGELTTLASDGAGGFFAAGAVVSGQTQGFPWLARIDGNGVDASAFGAPIVLPYSVLTGGNTTVKAVPDGAGNVVLAWQGVDHMAYISKYSSTGAQMWIVPASSASGVEIHVKSMSSDSSGGCWLGGQVVGGPFGGISNTFDDAWWMHVTSNGTIAYATQVGSATQAFELDFISADSDRVYVCRRVEGGTGSNDVVLSSFDPATGSGSILKDVWSPVPEVVVGIPTADSGGLLMLRTGANQPATLSRYALSACVDSLAYCVPSSTSIPGCGATLTTSGAPSVSSPTGYDIDVTSIPAPGACLLLFSATPTPTPVQIFTGGYLCVQSFKRSGGKLSNGAVGVCNGAVSFTLQDLLDADGPPAAPIVTAGEHLYVQAWGRDPDNPNGQPFFFSDAAQILLCP